MDKLKLHSPDFTQANIAKLAELFPNCVTEMRDAQGGRSGFSHDCQELKYAIDFDLLKQELSSSIVDGPQERYQLNWPGKREALLTANAPIAKTLRPCREESVDFDSTQNLFIEGDNLDALKLLQETYLGKVKMIYIDPPYNTGKEFIYDDDFSEDTASYFQRSNQKDEAGQRMVANTETNGRFHSDWLSMMYPRLKLARNLLRDDGVIFISIDDNEQANLKRLCDEVFGEDNFIAQLAVQLNPRGRHLDWFVAKTHESILVFGRNCNNPYTMYGVEKEGRMIEEYNREDEKGKYRLLGLRNRNQAFNPETRPNLYYPLYVNQSNGCVSISSDGVYTDEVWPDTPDGVKTCWTWGKEKVVVENKFLIAEKSGAEWRVYRKDYLVGDSGALATTLVKSLWTDKEISNDVGRKAIKDLFDNSVMDFPKSPELLKILLKTGNPENGIVLDFFSGSATTAHAIMALNAEDASTGSAQAGKRKFIMVQLPEACDEKSEAYKAGYKTIAEIGKERIRRAGQKIKASVGAASAANVGAATNIAAKAAPTVIDIGFRLLKIDSSNMKDVYYTPDTVQQSDLVDHVDNIREGRSAEDLLFQVLLDWGVDLTLPITQETIAGKTVLFVDGNALAACFDADINETFVKELAARHPLRVVFRDAGFASDSVKINIEQIFKLLSPTTEIKTI
jgi:adenine-specific DNA-methyltransferase